MSARTEFDAMKQGFNNLASNGYSSKPNVNLEEYEEFKAPEKIMYASVSQNDNTYNNEIKGEPTHEFYDNQPIQPVNAYEGYTESDYPHINEDDEALWPGGPLASEVESWKKQYNDIYMADEIDEKTIFIYRTINRYEYKAIVATPNTDPLMREEMICEQCVLFPYEYSYGMMSNGNAGNVTTLTEHILTSSGFTKASMPRRL